jgi:hypothetical protein
VSWHGPHSSLLNTYFNHSTGTFVAPWIFYKLIVEAWFCLQHKLFLYRQHLPGVVGFTRVLHPLKAHISLVVVMATQGGRLVMALLL